MSNFNKIDSSDLAVKTKQTDKATFTIIELVKIIDYSRNVVENLLSYAHCPLKK